MNHIIKHECNIEKNITGTTFPTQALVWVTNTKITCKKLQGSSNPWCGAIISWSIEGAPLWHTTLVLHGFPPYKKGREPKHHRHASDAPDTHRDPRPFTLCLNGLTSPLLQWRGKKKQEKKCHLQRRDEHSF